MNNQALADKIIASLLRKPEDGAELGFVHAVNICRHQGDWHDALRYCEQGHGLADQAGHHQPYLHAVADLCEGSVHHAQGEIQAAIRLYERARIGFSLNDAHGEAVARLALGLARRANYENLEALGHFEACLKSLQTLLNRHWREVNLRRLYHELITDLQGEVQRAQTARNLNRLFIPRGVSVAGKPLYSPDSDLWRQRVEIDGKGFELLDVGTRLRKGSLLRAADQYFVVDVKGSSMTIDDQTGIHEGDLLLVRQQPTVDDGTVAVVRLDEYYGSSTLVKRIRRRRDRIVLESDNPDFPPREFNAESPALTILGEAVAILRQA